MDQESPGSMKICTNIMLHGLKDILAMHFAAGTPADKQHCCNLVADCQTASTASLPLSQRQKRQGMTQQACPSAFTHGDPFWGNVVVLLWNAPFKMQVLDLHQLKVLSNKMCIVHRFSSKLSWRTQVSSISCAER